MSFGNSVNTKEAYLLSASHTRISTERSKRVLRCFGSRLVRLSSDFEISPFLFACYFKGLRQDFRINRILPDPLSFCWNEDQPHPISQSPPYTSSPHNPATPSPAVSPYHCKTERRPGYLLVASFLVFITGRPKAKYSVSCNTVPSSFNAWRALPRWSRM